MENPTEEKSTETVSEAPTKTSDAPEIKKDSEDFIKIKQLYATLESAQRQSGKFTMADCRNAIEARDVLLDFFSQEDEEPGKEESEAWEVFVRCFNIQQSSGSFLMEGSVKILDMLEDLEVKLQDPATKLRKMNERAKAARKKKQHK
jgi:hypothetical protein